METVSKMFGHKSLKMTHYAKIVDEKVSDDMKFLKNKYSQVIRWNCFGKILIV